MVGDGVGYMCSGSGSAHRDCDVCGVCVCVVVGVCIGVGVADVVADDIVCVGAVGVCVAVGKCVGVSGGVDSMSDGSGSAPLLALEFSSCFLGCACLRQKASLLCCGRKSAPLLSPLSLLSQLRLLPPLLLQLKTASAAISQVGILLIVVVVSVGLI